MESFINKIKSTVSEVLPGNPLNGDYEIADNVVGSAGPNLSWKIYNSVKKSTKEPASVFVFEKKNIEKMSKEDKKMILSSLRRGVQQLTKLRHPKILSVVHPIEENRDCLAFATEPVMMSLSNVIDPESPSKASLDEVEIKYGLLQLFEALGFLHNNAMIVHGNIHPSSVLMNDKKMWKLAGFDFFIPNSSPPGAERAQYDYKEYVSCLPECTQPELDYIAPECGTRGYCDTKSDLYSLGVFIHALFNHGKPLYQSHNSLASFKQHASEMRSFRQSLLRNIPSGFHASFKTLLNYDADLRPDVKSLSKNLYFEDTTVMTIVYLDTLVQRDNLQRSQFFKTLPNVIRQLPMGICIYRVLPVLFSECSNKDMIPFVLQNILIIADICSKQDYREHIFPKLKPILPISQPIQIPLLLLKNMTLLLKQTDERETKSHILPMLFTSIELDNSQLQELCLDILPSFSHLIDKKAMKTSVIPRVKKLCIATQYLNLRVKCLVSIGKMVSHMDKWFVLDEVLPFLPKIPSREPAILMAILGIYKIVFTNKELGIPNEQLATKSLPFLIPLSADHSLSRQQFVSYMSVIKDMMSTYDRENLTRLTELEKKEQGDSNNTLGFSGQEAASENVMKGFLSEAGLVGGGASRVSSQSPVSSNSRTGSPMHLQTKPTIQSTAPPQARDLTSTLGATTIQPIKPVPQSNSSPIRPLSQPPASQSLMKGASANNKRIPMGSYQTQTPTNFSRGNTNQSTMNTMLQPTTNNSSGINTGSTVANRNYSSTQQSSMAMKTNSPLMSMQLGNLNGSPGSTMNSNTGWSIAAPPQNTGSSSQSSKNAGWSFAAPTQPQAAWPSNHPIQTNTSNMSSNVMWPNNMNTLNQNPSTPSQPNAQLSQSDIKDLLG